MTDREARLRDLFDRARDLPPDAVHAWLDETCAGEPDLREEVLGLLRWTERANTPLDEPLLPVDALSVRATRPIPERIGHYDIVRLIGRGSMGAVYEAIQDNPRRTVALKVLRAGMATDTMLRRFQLEADVLGRLDHAYVARIHEAGTADLGHGPNPFLAMELVHGLPLDEWVAANAPDLRARLELVVRIGEGLRHAHARGVLHRDVKPGNILVDDHGDPRIVDFGVARALEGDLRGTAQRTAEGQLVGTLQYMSPEQAAGSAEDVDARTDVYALGVVAYELLCGRLPYELDGETLPRALQKIVEEEPPRLGAVDRTLRGDVATIVATSLEKDRDRRYQSMAEFVADLRRHLADQPITARRTSTLEHVTKFARRHRALAGGLAVGVVLLALGIAAMIVGLIEAREQAEVAEQRLAEVSEARDAADRARGEAASALDRALDSRAEAERARSDAETARGDMELALQEAEAVTGFITDALLSVHRENLGYDVRVSEMLDGAADRLAADFGELPRVAARLHLTLARTFRAVGRRETSHPHFRRAWELFRDEYGPTDGRTVFAQSGFVTSLFEVDAYDEALALNDELERFWLEVEGPDGRNVLSCALQRGLIERAREDLPAAEAILAPIAERAARVLGDDDELTCEVRRALGETLRNRSRFDEAEVLLRAVVKTYRERRGLDHADTLAAERELAELLLARGDLREARELYDRLLTVHEEAYAPDDPRTALILGELGQLHFEEGRYEEALRCVADAGDRLTRSLGPGNTRTLKMRDRQAHLLLRFNRLDEAEDVLLDTLAYYDETRVGPLTSLTAVRELGAIRFQQGRLEEARELWTAALAGLRAQIIDDYPEIPHLLMDLSAVERMEERPDAAAELLEEARVLYRRLYGPDSLDELRARSNLGSVEMERGRLDAAEEHFLAILEPMRTQLGQEHPDFLMMLGFLGELRGEQGRYEEAETILRAVIPTTTRLLSESHPLTRTQRETLARVLLGDGRIEEAIALLRQIRAHVVARSGEGSIEAIASTEALAWGLIELDRRDEAMALVDGFVEALDTAGTSEFFLLPVRVLAASLRGDEGADELESLRDRAVELWGEGNEAATNASEALAKLGAGTDE